MNGKKGCIQEFDEFRIDLDKKVLWRDDKLVSLPCKTVELLCVLVENKGEIVTKDELLNKVWQDSFVEESVLPQNIYLLRKTFKNLNSRENPIQTIPRRGYRFAGEVHEIEDELVIEHEVVERSLVAEISEDSLKDLNLSGLAETSRPKPLRQKSRFVFASILILAFSLLIGFAVWQFDQSSEKNSLKNIKSIAVLPLKSFSEKSENRELRLRITDALITKLGNLPEISVRPTASVLRFNKNENEPLEAGRLLGVDAILDGRVQTEGKNLRVTLQLISVAGGKQLWSGQFDGKTNEILNLQDKISAELTQKLATPSTRKQDPELAKRPTTNAEAYEAYLEGRFLWNKRTTPELKKAVSFFEKAIQLDHGFALAYAGLADTYSMLASRSDVSRFEDYAKAKQMAYKALEIDPNLSEAYSALGWVFHKHEWNWAEAEKAFAKAIELNPGNVDAHHWRGLNFRAQGRFEEFFAEMEKARQLAPLTWAIDVNYYEVVLRREGCQKALEYKQKFDELHETPSYRKSHSMADHFYRCGDYEQAFSVLRTVPSEQLSLRALTFLGLHYARNGNRAEALKILERINQLDTSNKYYHMPLIYAELGEYEAAFAYLEKAYQARDDRMTNLKAEPGFQMLRDEPRFQEILRKMNLN